MSEFTNLLILGSIRTGHMWCPASEGEAQERVGTFSLLMKSRCIGLYGALHRSVIADVDMSRGLATAQKQQSLDAMNPLRIKANSRGARMMSLT